MDTGTVSVVTEHLDRWRSVASRWWGPTEAQPSWSMAGHALVGLVVGALAGVAVGLADGVVLSAFAGAVVAVAGSARTMRASMALGLVLVVVVPPVMFAAFLSGRWWPLAALSMGLVTFIGSIAVTIGPLYAQLASLASIANLVALVVGVVQLPSGAIDAKSCMVLVMIGAGSGLLVVAVSIRVRHVSVGEESADASAIVVWKRLTCSVRTVDIAARVGIRRSVPLAVCAGTFAASANRDSFWVLVTVFAVLMPSVMPLAETIVIRLCATVIAVVLVGFSSTVMPFASLVVLAVVVTTASVVYVARHPLPGVIGYAVSAIVLAAASLDEVSSLAQRRLADTAVGSVIALIAVTPRRRGGESGTNEVAAGPVRPPRQGSSS